MTFTIIDHSRIKLDTWWLREVEDVRVYLHILLVSPVSKVDTIRLDLVSKRLFSWNYCGYSVKQQKPQVKVRAQNRKE